MINWKFNKKEGTWKIEDKFAAFISSEKLDMPVIRFCGHKMRVFPIYSEETGKLLGYRTTVQKDWGNDVFPAFFSKKEIQKIRIDK